MDEGKRIRLVAYDPSWPAQFRSHAATIAAALGDQALRIEHIGSTAVPGLVAKASVDILLVVPDSADEPAYRPGLEAAGYRLRIREPHWHEHRLFHPLEGGAKVHVVSRGCTEIDRWVSFRDRLRNHAGDRELYARTKRDLARKTWRDTNDYAEAKSEVIARILARGRSMEVTEE